jgi:transposase
MSESSCESSTSSMYFVGLDVHQKRSSICILDRDGRQVKRLEVKGSWAKVVEAVAQVPGPFCVCYEASCGYGHLYEKLAPLARHVAVAHPGQLRLIYKSKRKNDRVDAAKLAKLLYLDLVPQVHVPRADVRAWRALITYRHRLMSKRVGVKNQIRALLRGLGIVAPSGKRLWSGKGLAWLKQQELAAESDALRRDMSLEELAEVNGKIRRVEKELDRRADAHPAVALLKTIPGVGVRTAEAVVAHLDDVGRFSRNKKVGSYFGLVPCQDQSAGRDRLGHITRDGPPAVRKLLCEAAWQGIRRSPALKGFFERVARGEADRRKIALVATAHHLARVMAAMLRTGEVWREPPGGRPRLKDKEGRAAPDGGPASPPRKTTAA